MAVAVICLYMKRVFDTWLLDLEKKQSEYLSTLERDETDHSLLEVSTVHDVLCNRFGLSIAKSSYT